MKNSRLEYVDIFRGLAVLIMVAIQLFSFISISNIYIDRPYYVKVINSVTWFPPSVLFSFVAGISVFLLIEIRKKMKKPLIKEVLRKYLKYFLLSLPFTIVMFGLAVWFRWEEAVQGIALTAIVLGILLSYLKRFSYFYFSLLIFLLASLQYFLRYLLEHVNSIPYEVNANSFFVNFGSVFFNMFVRGWFSLINLLPFMLGGIILFNFIKEKKIKQAFWYGAILILFSVVLHILGIKINYYDRSFSYAFFGVGESILLFLAIYFLYEKTSKMQFWNIFKIYGLTAFFVYIFHYLFIIKVLELLHWTDKLNDYYSWGITLILLIIIYFIAKIYLTYRKYIPEYIRL